MRIRFRQSGLAGHLYVKRSPDDAPRPLAAVCPGLPYEPTEEAITPWLVDQGWDVAQIQYEGTYDSDGVFSPQSAIASVQHLLDVLQDGRIFDPKARREVDVAGSVAALFGHSFGSWVALRALEQVDLPACMVMAPSYAYGADARSVGIVSSLETQARYIEEALPHTFRLSSTDEWQTFFTSSTETPWIPENVKGTPFIAAVVGEKDESYDLNTLNTTTETLRDRAPGEMRPLFVIEGAGHGLEGVVDNPEWQRLAAEVLKAHDA